MSQTNPLHDTPFDNSAGVTTIPPRLNTLTILTYIGCGLAFLLSLLGFFNSKSSYDNLVDMQENGKLDQMPSFLKNMMGGDAVEMARKAYENRVPLLIMGLVGVALCVYGATQMRQLKKQGYYIWLIGEILPFIVSAIFIGAGFFSTTTVISLLIILLFVYLYYTQVKFMH